MPARQGADRSPPHTPSTNELLAASGCAYPGQGCELAPHGGRTLRRDRTPDSRIRRCHSAAYVRHTRLTHTQHPLQHPLPPPRYHNHRSHAHCQSHCGTCRAPHGESAQAMANARSLHRYLTSDTPGHQSGRRFGGQAVVRRRSTGHCSGRWFIHQSKK